jgi:hypothetical protein
VVHGRWDDIDEACENAIAGQSRAKSLVFDFFFGIDKAHL